MRHRHKFNSSEGAWKASTVLKASFLRCNIVDFRFPKLIKTLETS